MSFNYVAWQKSNTSRGRTATSTLRSNALVYTLLHLVVVLPVVVLRYLRVHFFLVEAASVELRPGMEASMGFSPTVDS